ncbi:NB-ARC domain-containing protein [Phormidesmis sp. 146-33]
MTQHNSQPQPDHQYLVGDIQISGDGNEFNFVQGNNNHFFKYEITPQGGVVNILPPEQAPRITALQTPIRLLPRLSSDLFGRKTEIGQSVMALEASQTIELYGSAGIGKSVLLRQLAHHKIAASLKYFPDGVIYFHLLREEPVEDLQQKLFEAFYASDRPFKPSAIRVRHELQNKRALILLDNAKLSRKDIEKLGETAPNCVFAFTSSERSLWGEGHPIQVGGLSLDASLDLIERELKRSLTAQEQAAVTAICTDLNGHPLEILQHIAGVRESKEWLADVAGRVQKNTSQKARTEQLLKPLSQQKRSILAALAALGGIAISAKQALAIADEGTESDLGTLREMHLVQQEGSRYSLSANLLDSVKQIENLTPYMERAVFFVTKWAQNTTPEKLQQESEAISHLLQWSVKQGRWNDVLLLGKPFESALALSGQWELQAQVLQWYEQAAENLGDNSAVAWVLHQSGVRSLGLGETFRARNLLNQAFKLRQKLGDLRGAELTQRCLNFKFPTVPPITDFLEPPAPQPSPPHSPWTDFLKKILIPTFVTGGLVGAGMLIAPRIQIPPGDSTPPKISAPTSDPGSIASETPIPEPSPTPIQDPSISSCVAADVKVELNIRPSPDLNAEAIGKLSSRQQASTTKMRQGDFIEISDPIKGWINAGFTQPCDSKNFARAPKPIPSKEVADSQPEVNQPSSDSPSQPQKQLTQVYKGPWSSDVINGLQLIVDEVEKTDGVAKLYVRAKNHTTRDLNLSFFFNGFYAFDNLGNPYSVGANRWSDVIPASGTTRAYITLQPEINPDASSVTVTFGNTGQGPGDSGGGKLSVSGIQVK